MELIDVAVETPLIGTGASLNVAVAGSLVLYRLAGFPSSYSIQPRVVQVGSWLRNWPDR
jgi:hypothetical protein